MRALVCGATGELGRAVVDLLAEDGWDLHLHGNSNTATLDELAAGFGLASPKGIGRPVVGHRD